MSEQKPERVDDYLVWVGGGSYSRESLVKEAQRMGVCRRVPFIPHYLKKGVSRVFMISDMTDEDRERYKKEFDRRDKERYLQWKGSGFEKGYTSHVVGPMPRGSPVIFAYFVVRGISYVVAPGVDIPKELKKRGVEEWEYEEGGFGFNDERECGSLDVGGTYLLSEEDMNKCKDLAESGTLKGRVVILNPPIPYRDKRFRGIKTVSRALGDRLVGG